MIPYIVDFGWFKIGSYGLMMALGFLVSGWLLSRELRRRGYSPDIAWEVVLAGAIGGVVGARVLDAIERWEDLLADPIGVLISRGGLTWYGGFLGGAIAVIILFRLRRLPLVSMLDAVSPELLTGYAFGRGGCQLSGDGCYGVPTHSAFGMGYPHGLVPTPEGILVHPTPLYEITYSLAGFAMLWFWLRKKPLPRGAMFAIFLIYQAVARFMVEFIRRNDRYWLSFDHGWLPDIKVWHYGFSRADGFEGFSLSQWVAIAMFIWGAVWLISLWRHPTPTDPIPILPLPTDPDAAERDAG